MTPNSFKDKNSPHFWWLFSICGVLIIFLISFILTHRMLCADKVMEYISYASVILSITLSIFAILYTYTSNVQIQQQFEKINSAANNIATTSDRLTNVGNKLNDNLDIILQQLKSIDGKQTEMSDKVNNINAQFDTSVNNISFATKVNGKTSK